MDRILSLESETLQQMKQASLNKVKAYSWDRVAQMTIQKIEEKLFAL
jgi:hypothetical protein